VFAVLAQRNLFGLPIDAFEINLYITTGLSFLSDVASEMIEVIASHPWITAGCVVVFIGIACILLWRGGIAALRLLVLGVFALTLWRLWYLDLPSTFIADVFKDDPRVLVQAHKAGPLFRERAEGLWRLLVCDQVPAGLQAMTETYPQISCPDSPGPGRGLQTKYRHALGLAVIVLGFGLLGVKLDLTYHSKVSTYGATLILLMAYQLCITPFLYGRLKMRPDFPEVYLYVRDSTAPFPQEVNALFEGGVSTPPTPSGQRQAPHKAKGRKTTADSKESWRRMYGYLVEKKENLFGMLVPLKISCPVNAANEARAIRWQWHRVNIASSDVSMVRLLDFSERQGTLVPEYLRRPQTCPGGAAEPPPFTPA